MYTPEALLMFSVAILIVVSVFLFLTRYERSSYHKITHKSLFSVCSDKGCYGEYLIYKKLREEESSGGKFLFNTYLMKNDTETTEIDVILINANGVFVFESKNYSGWIFGQENQKNWTQCLPQGKGKPAQKEYFLNPIFQNILHIEALKKYIGDDVPIYSVITFSERCTLKNIDVSNPLVRVINRDEVSSTVAALGKQSETVLSKNEILGIYETLYPFTQVSKAVKEQHIESIRATHSETTAGAFPTTSDNEELLCPKCGASLVLRTAKRGNNAGKQFYGCSNYPQCHFIKNI